MPYEVSVTSGTKQPCSPLRAAPVHPLGKSPLIEDRDSDGKVRVIAELAQSSNTSSLKRRQVRRALAREEALRYRYFLHYAEAR